MPARYAQHRCVPQVNTIIYLQIETFKDHEVVICVMSKKRDQRVYDLFQKYRFTFVLRVLILIVNNLDGPYGLKASVSGVHGYPPRAMAIFVFIMEEFHLTYRGAVGYLNGHREKLKAMGLNKVPSKSTIHRNSAKISDEYYRQMHFKVIKGIVTGNMAGDSSGFSVRKFIPWFSVKKMLNCGRGGGANYTP